MIEKLLVERNFAFSKYKRDRKCVDFANYKHLKSNATGPENLPPKFVKLVLYYFLSYLTFLFNSILTMSTYPASWKVAKVVAIAKKSSPSQLSDFRPISLWSFMSKMKFGVSTSCIVIIRLSH